MTDTDNDFFNDEQQHDEGKENLLNLLDSCSDRERHIPQRGEKVSGRVLSIGKEYAFVDIGATSEALIKISELKNDQGLVTLHEGDPVEAFVISSSETELELSMSLSGYQADIRDLSEAMRKKMPVQGKVTGINKGGLQVKIMGHRAFCPVSHIDIKYVSDVNVYFGRTMAFCITRISEGGRNIVLSRLPLLEQKLEQEIRDLEAKAHNREMVSGTITRITHYGLFVDCGILEGLIHISEVSWSRADHLEDTFHPGDTVEAVVLGIERKEPLRASKLSLSLRHATPDPWGDVPTQFPIGSVVQGTVTRNTQFGAFVELQPGVEGLVRLSELSWERNVRHPRDVVNEGDQVRVTVLDIDEKKREISLSLKDRADDPWNDITTRFPLGTAVPGEVVKQMRYGYFVDLAQGVTGLLVNQNIGSDKRGEVRVGEKIEVTIQSIDEELHRIALTFGIADQAGESQPHTDTVEQAATTAPASDKNEANMTTSEFGNALLEALKKKSDS